MNDEPWYSVKCVFEHKDLAHTAGSTVYEERIVVLRARNFDDAVARGEAEAIEYAHNNKHTFFTGFISAYHLFSEKIKDKTEVYSLMRESALDYEAFLDRFHDDGTERVQQI